MINFDFYNSYVNIQKPGPSNRAFAVQSMNYYFVSIIQWCMRFKLNGTFLKIIKSLSLEYDINQREDTYQGKNQENAHCKLLFHPDLLFPIPETVFIFKIMGKCLKIIDLG